MSVRLSIRAILHLSDHLSRSLQREVDPLGSTDSRGSVNLMFHPGVEGNQGQKVRVDVMTGSEGHSCYHGGGAALKGDHHGWNTAQEKTRMSLSGLERVGGNVSSPPSLQPTPGLLHPKVGKQNPARKIRIMLD